jgi:hypothetical protein
MIWLGVGTACNSLQQPATAFKILKNIKKYRKL